MPRVKDSQYIFAVSRIRAIEKSLLDNEIVNSLIYAATSEAAFKILKEAHYGESDQAADGERADMAQRLHSEEYKKLVGLVRGMAADPGVFDIFLLPRDFHNVKVLMKADFMGMECGKALLYDCGSIAVSQLVEMIRDRKYGEMPSIMGHAVEEAMEDFHHTGDPQTVDLILDKACFRQMRAKADGYRHVFLQEYVAGTVDVINLLLYLRLKRFKTDMAFLENVLLPGGTVPPEVWPAKEKAVKVFAGEIAKNSPAGEICGRLLAEADILKPELYGERGIYEFKSIFIRKGKSEIDGIEPLAGYFLEKETEIGDVRTILTGKIIGLPGDRIKERLRKVYA